MAYHVAEFHVQKVCFGKLPKRTGCQPVLPKILSAGTPDATAERDFAISTIFA
jgi:hypothetical protein